MDWNESHDVISAFYVHHKSSCYNTKDKDSLDSNINHVKPVSPTVQVFVNTIIYIFNRSLVQVM